ncbi:MAG: spike base protein, RCAP_Rcc01079 family [Ilumatobacteraceae bacterium]
MPDLWVNDRNQQWGPAHHAVAVTPNDSTDLTDTSRALYVGAAGDVKVDMYGSGTVTFVGVTAGSVLPVRVDRVYSTGTTATSIVALW